MHVIQYVATTADNAESAHSFVKNYLESLMGNDESHNTWYDWFIVGGGRWSSAPDPYDDEWIVDVVHQDSPKFQEYLDNAHKWRLEAVATDIKYARETDVAALLDKIENDQEGLYPMFSESMKLYPFRNLYNHLSGSWGPDSYFFDIISDCTHPTYMKQGIDNGDKNWYIIPVDFHY